MTREDLSGCVTNEELARLFEHAFGTWQSSSPDPEGRRETPRVLTGEAKPIFVVSYAYKGAKSSSIAERPSWISPPTDWA